MLNTRRGGRGIMGKLERRRKRCLTPGGVGEELWENYSVSQTKC